MLEDEFWCFNEPDAGRNGCFSGECLFTLETEEQVLTMGNVVDVVVHLVDANDKERFAESKKELDALLLDESLSNVLFLILGNEIDMHYAASEVELRYYLCITGLATGKGKVNLAHTNV